MTSFFERRATVLSRTAIAVRSRRNTKDVATLQERLSLASASIHEFERQKLLIEVKYREISPDQEFGGKYHVALSLLFAVEAHSTFRP